MGDIKFKGIYKSFGDSEVLKDIDLEINKGEMFTFLGPSGCGKTTLLRILAGFENADNGSIELEGRNILKVLPEKRDIAMVFQNYALFPHMNVEQNVGYGLKVRGIEKSSIKKVTDEKLEMVGLKGFEKRNISSLSGGEQQRVCIARALAVDPKVLLLDEPLSNLDAKIREHMRSEIREIQKKLGITTIFVTHDQKEAMAISDRVAVFNLGKVIQVDEPVALYNSPSCEFVARFIDDSNIIKKSDYTIFGLDEIESDMVSVRTQNISIVDDSSISGVVEKVEFNGSLIVYDCDFSGLTIRISQPNITGSRFKSKGDIIHISIDKESIVRLDR